MITQRDHSYSFFKQKELKMTNRKNKILCILLCIVIHISYSNELSKTALFHVNASNISNDERHAFGMILSMHLQNRLPPDQFISYNTVLNTTGELDTFDQSYFMKTFPVNKYIVLEVVKIRTKTIALATLYNTTGTALKTAKSSSDSHDKDVICLDLAKQIYPQAYTPPVQKRFSRPSQEKENDKEIPTAKSQQRVVPTTAYTKEHGENDKKFKRFDGAKFSIVQPVMNNISFYNAFRIEYNLHMKHKNFSVELSGGGYFSRYSKRGIFWDNDHLEDKVGFNGFNFEIGVNYAPIQHISIITPYFGGAIDNRFILWGDARPTVAMIPNIQAGIELFRNYGMTLIVSAKIGKHLLPLESSKSFFDIFDLNNIDKDFTAKKIKPVEFTFSIGVHR